MDAGDALWKSANIPEALLPQQLVKGDLIAHAFALGGIDALTPGEGDLALGLGWYKQIVEKYGLPVVSANLSCADGPVFAHALRLERSGVRLGLTAVIAPDLAPAGCTASEPVAAAHAALASLGPVDVTVVLAHDDRDDDRALADALPEVDLVVNGHARLTNDAPLALPNAALQLAAGSRGRSVGVATITLNPGARGFQSMGALDDLKDRIARNQKRLDAVNEKMTGATSEQIDRLQRQQQLYQGEADRLAAELADLSSDSKGPRNSLTNSLIMLDTRVDDEKGTAALLEAAKAQMSQVELTAPITAAAEGPRTYVGAERCKACHAPEYAQWQGTAHASAWASLEKAGRAMDHECAPCHATGLGEPGGPTTPATVGALRDVQCESCHGPGKDHVASPTTAAMLAAPDTTTCVTCHDGVRDEGRFDAGAYLPRVVHTAQGEAGGAEATKKGG